MTRTIYKRCSITLDPGTIQRAKELSRAKGQSVSSLIRYLLAEASEEAATKRVQGRIERP
jgi:Family of unknown function (DUF6364)